MAKSLRKSQSGVARRPVTLSTNELDVFINCPFDDAYKPFFYAIVWTVMRYGYRARCALEADNSGQDRLQKISRLIAESRFAIHDISRTEPDSVNNLPRFNMPLELGMWLGAERYGGVAQADKQCVIFDTEPYRFQKFISDIGGHDIHSHSGSVDRLIVELTKWLRTLPGEDHPGGGEAMIGEFRIFLRVQPNICAVKRLTQEELTFGDFTGIADAFLRSLNDEPLVDLAESVAAI